LNTINRTLDEYRRLKMKRVRIAILDTGIDMTHPDFQPLDAKDRIIQQEDFLGCASAPDEAPDECGHGTHLVSLIRKISPTSDIYVARIVRDFDAHLDENVVAEVSLNTSKRPPLAP
jgi:hypothetical protein